jgi:hypothetical protein
VRASVGDVEMNIEELYGKTYWTLEHPLLWVNYDKFRTASPKMMGRKGDRHNTNFDEVSPSIKFSHITDDKSRLMYQPKCR